MKFAVFTDLHYDVIHDGDRRISEFINSVKENGIDFVIELGDLCHPKAENDYLITSLKELGIQCFFQIGNHDSGAFSNDVVLKFFDIKNNYYSFVYGSVKFIVLDANYIKTPNGSLPFSKRNYEKTRGEYPYIPQEEIEWLKNELIEEQFYYVILSHQSLSNDFMQRGISNRKEIRDILEERNQKGKKVLLCMNGHDHGDDVKAINGIHYYTLNSMSYIWHGIKETFSYSEEIHRKYPYLKDLILYQEALHIIVSIDEDMNIEINGVEGHYQNITPSDIGIGNTWNGVSIEPRTSSLHIDYK
jgi:calcineurin-like phosphoesterase family protein